MSTILACNICARALQYIVLFHLGLNVAVKFHNLVVVTSIILWNLLLERIDLSVLHVSVITLSRGPNWVLTVGPAVPKSHIVGRVDTP